MENLKTVVEAGLHIGQCCKDNRIFGTYQVQFAAINAIYAYYFTGEAPASVQVAALPKGALFEIEAIAVG